MQKTISGSGANSLQGWKPRIDSAGFDFGGTYDEVIIHQKIAYSMSDDRRVEVHFEDRGEETKVTETFDAENVNDIELQKQGWQAILDNFKRYTESQ